LALPVLAMLVAAGDLLIAGAAAETRAGESPIVPGEAPRAFVGEIVTPSLGVRVGRPSDMFSAYYAPRILFQQPNAADQLAPLTMHTGRLLLTTPLSRRMTLALSADASYGKPDYTTLTQILGATQGALPQVATIFSTSGQASLRIAATRRLDLSLGSTIFYYDQIDALPQSATTVMPPPGTNRIITHQTAVGIQPVVSYRLSPVDQLVVDTAATVASYFSDVQVLTAHFTGGFRRRLSRVHTLRFTIGVGYARDVGAVAFLAPNIFPVSPAGELRLESRLTRQGAAALYSRVGTMVDYSVDPVLGTTVPRGVVYGRLVMILNPDWTFSPEGDFGTSLRTKPVSAQDPDETAISLVLPARRRVSPNVALEFGVRYSDRGPTLASPNFHFHQRQLYAFFTIAATTLPTRRAIATTP
jgi:hypothetical protein